MIYTSNYENFNGSNYRTNSISWGKGVEYDYDGKSYMELAPLKSFWRTWKDNIGKISEEENNKYYIEQYYDLILSKLDVEKVYNDLDNSVLLCCEENNLFCHITNRREVFRNSRRVLHYILMIKYEQLKL